ncbi:MULTISPECIES: hypothetical protein [Sporosarcina]|nr:MULTISPECIES: hypothetical protein [Sporosarcina]WJY27305.1 hypothetical protein QWT68_14885 [Sporosarcina sp. 0.2-SM1T-5]
MDSINSTWNLGDIIFTVLIFIAFAALARGFILWRIARRHRNREDGR